MTDHDVAVNTDAAERHDARDESQHGDEAEHDACVIGEVPFTREDRVDRHWHVDGGY